MTYEIWPTSFDYIIINSFLIFDPAVDFFWKKMNTLQRAICLNNKGVSLLESNSTACAIQVLQNGIQWIKEFAHRESRIGPAESRKSMPASFVDDCFFQINAGRKLEGLQAESYYTYDRPLLLRIASIHPVEDEFEAPQDVYAASVVLIFNLALAYHHHAKKCGLSSVQKHAIKMYHLAMKMADCTEIDQCLGKALTCFILNNLANIHSDLCEFGTCEYCLKCIKETFWNDVHVDFFANGFIEEEEWVEIKLNCIYGHLPSAAQAA